VKVVLVGVFAGLGAVVRYLFSQLSLKFTSWKIPWGTYIVNILGSFLIGLFFALHLNNDLYSYLAAGFCGGLTTFSTYNFELFNLIDQKKYKLFTQYFALSYGIGTFALFIGVSLGKILS
jgi:CrcB protein